MTDLVGSNQVDKFWELTASASVYAQHTLLMHCDAMQLQWNLVLGVSTHNQHTALQTPDIHHTRLSSTVSLKTRHLLHSLYATTAPQYLHRKNYRNWWSGAFTDKLPFLVSHAVSDNWKQQRICCTVEILFQVKSPKFYVDQYTRQPSVAA